MAVCKQGSTKSANQLIRYAEKRADVTSTINLPSDDRKVVEDRFKRTREQFGKNGSIQAHHVIQSFKPNEISPEQANELGRRLAEKIAKGHEVVVYTHTDKEHIHNHIIINSVNFETGKKYYANKKSLEGIRKASDQLCREKGLSIVQSSQEASKRYTRAEIQMIMKGKMPFKEKLRIGIDYIRKSKPVTFTEFQTNLKTMFDIEAKITKKHIAFKTAEQERFTRGKQLGADYTKESIENELATNKGNFTRRISRNIQTEYGDTATRNDFWDEFEDTGRENTTTRKTELVNGAKNDTIEQSSRKHIDRLTSNDSKEYGRTTPDESTVTRNTEIIRNRSNSEERKREEERRKREEERRRYLQGVQERER